MNPIQIYHPDGQPFLSYLQLDAVLRQERQRAEAERQRADRFAERLRQLGIDPNEV
jgi:hypothetical protein